ncbi:T9SS C-terminal target domain-containing protein [Aquimarina agarivorans]|uniref:T9SS C-terminal target domain-containing protein n=1 Tax=Aquimarina agarivorans TaxID=980584 RepID=UPI000248E61D|nr:T9SS C-terminal target domain-containing protein [Aquimarina agarivorans]
MKKFLFIYLQFQIVLFFASNYNFSIIKAQTLRNAVEDEDLVCQNSANNVIDILVNDTFGTAGPNTSTDHLQVTGVTDAGGNIRVSDNGTSDDLLDDFILYDSPAGFSGFDSFSYIIVDENGDTDSATVRVEVINTAGCSSVNAENDSFEIDEDSDTINFRVLVNDTFGVRGASESAIAIISGPSNGMANVNSNGTPADPTDDSIDYKPAKDYFGTDQITYEICDAGRGCDTATISITVVNLNDIPNALFDSAEVDENSSNNEIDVLDNDTFGGDGPGTTSINITVPPINGVATVDDQGTPADVTDDIILYTPTVNSSANDSLSYEICDVDGECASASVNIMVNEVNGLPVAIADDFSINEDAILSLLNVLSNDDFGSDGAGSFTVVGLPANGTVIVNAGTDVTDPTDDVLEYTPNPNFFGNDALTYEICDSNGDCVVGNVAIVIEAVNDLPSPVDDLNMVAEDSVNNEINVLDNDSFGGDGPSTTAITITINPTNGVATVNTNGTPNDPTDDILEYIPNPDFFGNDELTYQICDADGSCETAKVEISVTNDTTDLPNAVDDMATISEDSVDNEINVLENDTFGGDGAGNTAIAITVTPTNGVATVNTNGTPNDPTDNTITYTPESNFFGTDILTYEICDASTDCTTAVVTITVTNDPSDTPVAVEDSITVDEDSSDNEINVLENDDFGGDGAGNTAIAITVNPTNGVATVNTNGTPNDPTDDIVTYTPELNFFGTDTLTYEICDASADCITAVVTITVTNNTFDTPVAVEDSITVDEDSTNNEINILDNDTFGGDGASTTAAIKIISDPTNGIATISTNDTAENPFDDFLLYTPDPEFSGVDTLIYEICDTNGDCDQAEVTITVNELITSNPQLSLLKSGNYVDANNDGILNSGDIIEYTFTIINTGNEVLTDINVTDLLAGVVVSGVPFSLNPQEEDSTTFSATYTINASDITNGQVINQAMVIATSPSGDSVIDDSDDPDDPSNIDSNNDGEPDDPTIIKLEPENDDTETDVTVFETFTPNGDAVNDEFVIKNLENYPINTLKIFNRWGLKVFEEDGYGQADSSKFVGQSDGRATINRSAKLPTGTYFYTLNYQNSNGDAKTKAGSFYLVK